MMLGGTGNEAQKNGTVRLGGKDAVGGMDVATVKLVLKLLVRNAKYQIRGWMGGDSAKWE